jgi:hypothetical protein
VPREEDRWQRTGLVRISCVSMIHEAGLQNARIANGKANRLIMFDSMAIRYRGLVDSTQTTEVAASFSSKAFRP